LISHEIGRPFHEKLDFLESVGYDRMEVCGEPDVPFKKRRTR